MEKLDTKEQILRIGLRFLRKQSYNSFSFGDIAREMGIKKSSIHYHFPSKEVLGIALVQYYHDLLRTYISRLGEDLTPKENLEQFINFFKIGLEKNYLCPAGVLSVEFFTLPVEMQDELRRLFNYILDWVTGICESGLKTGEFSFQGDARTMAFQISTSIQGATAMARAYNTNKLYNDSLEILLNNIN